MKTVYRNISFSEFRHFLEQLGYRHKRVQRGEVFIIDRSRMLYYRQYNDDEAVRPRDLASTRSFLDDWNQMEPDAFDAFVAAEAKPA